MITVSTCRALYVEKLLRFYKLLMYEISKRLFVNEVTLQVLLFSTTEQCLPTPQLQTDRHSTAACRLEPVRETPAHRAPLPIAQHW